MIFQKSDWNFSEPGHARGQCPFHEGESGTSAWLDDSSGQWKFHCSSCTNNDPRDAFEYWLATKRHISIEDPSTLLKDGSRLAGRKWSESMFKHISMKKRVCLGLLVLFLTESEPADTKADKPRETPISESLSI